jgi:hypothetical protein
MHENVQQYWHYLHSITKLVAIPVHNNRNSIRACEIRHLAIHIGLHSRRHDANCISNAHNNLTALLAPIANFFTIRDDIGQLLGIAKNVRNLQGRNETKKKKMDWEIPK